MAAGVKERGIQLKNLLHTRRIACEIVVPLAAMGLDGKIPLDNRVRLRGSDPVHPSREAYSNLAAKILEKEAMSSIPEQADNIATKGGQEEGCDPRQESGVDRRIRADCPEA